MRNLAKYRVSAGKNLITIKSRLSFGEEINIRELEIFDQQLLRGFFRPKPMGKKNLIYTAPDAVAIGKYLKTPVTREVFFEIVAQILEAAKRVEMNGLYLGNLILDLGMVFICARTKEVFFVYQPLISRFSAGNLYAFVGDVTEAAGKSMQGLPEFLAEFKAFLANPSNYKTEDLEAYVRKACPQAYQKIVAADAGRSGFITDDRIAYENHYGNGPSDASGTTLLWEEEAEGTALLDDGEGTVLLTPTETYPVITRLRTGEQREIDRESFLVGKESSCNFCIGDNRAVSRRHALIEKKAGVYYITDQNSTNHTWVNDEQLKGGVPYELSDQSLIRMADEEFKYTW